MAVVQEAFDIPSDMMTKLINGDYRRIGGVVRHAGGPNKGQIVKHLKPVDIKESSSRNVIARDLEKVKTNHKVSMTVGATTTIIGGILFYKKLKNREPAVLKEFRDELKCYIDAIRLGNLNLDLINNMHEAIKKLKQHKDYNKFSIQLTTEDIEDIVTTIQAYTIKLANDNVIDIEEFKREESSGVISTFENYLNAQRKVFKETA